MLWESTYLELPPVSGGNIVVEGISTSAVQFSGGIDRQVLEQNHQSDILRLFDNEYGNADGTRSIGRSLFADAQKDAHGLRPLTGEEWNLISGGGWTVWAPEPLWDRDEWEDYWSHDRDNDGGGNDSGGGDDSGPYDYNTWLQGECAADLEVDMKARQIEALIKATPDWNEREYGAVIYMVNGEVRMTALARGMTVAEAVAAGLDAPRTVIPVPADLGDGVILAVIHSHPDVGYTAAEDLDNHYPSSYLNSNGTPGGDYGLFNSLVGSDSRFGNSAAFAQYILGPDGVLREFNARDGTLNRNNDPNAANRSNLASDRPCNN